MRESHESINRYPPVIKCSNGTVAPFVAEKTPRKHFQPGIFQPSMKLCGRLVTFTKILEASNLQHIQHITHGRLIHQETPDLYGKIMRTGVSSLVPRNSMGQVAVGLSKAHCCRLHSGPDVESCTLLAARSAGHRNRKWLVDATLENIPSTTGYILSNYNGGIFHL